MKNQTIILATVITLALLLIIARGVRLEWDETDDMSVVKYGIWGMPKNGEWTKIGETPANPSIDPSTIPSFTFNQPAGEWSWAVTAINIHGLESSKSIPVATAGFLAPPMPRLTDGTVIFTFQNLDPAYQWRIETSTNLQTWIESIYPTQKTTLLEVLVPATGPARFFRATRQ